MPPEHHGYRHMPPGSVNLKSFNDRFQWCVLGTLNALNNVGVTGDVSKAISEKSLMAGTGPDRLWEIMGNSKMYLVNVSIVINVHIRGVW